MPRKRKICTDDEQTYEITVWNDEGDIVKKHWNGTAADLEYCEEIYGDDARYIVVSEPR